MEGVASGGGVLSGASRRAWREWLLLTLALWAFVVPSWALSTGHRREVVETGLLGTAALAPAMPDTYDFLDRLIVRHRADGVTIRLHYDADGIRIGKTLHDLITGQFTYHVYRVCTNNLTGYAQVLEERVVTPDGETLRTYTYGHDLLSETTHSSLPATRYYLYDGFGSVRALADESGAITDHYTYDAFGVLIHHEGTSDNAYLYRGEQYDADLGMYYLRARFYNPDSGRFWNQDTYEGRNGEPATLHKYLYAHADPVNGRDPSGYLTLLETQVTTSIAMSVNILAAQSAANALQMAKSIFNPSGEMAEAIDDLILLNHIVQYASMAVAVYNVGQITIRVGPKALQAMRRLSGVGAAHLQKLYLGATHRLRNGTSRASGDFTIAARTGMTSAGRQVASNFDDFLVGRNFTSPAEARKAFDVYQRAAGAEKGILIGHGDDAISLAFDGWQAFRIMERQWTPRINMAWIDGAVDAGKPVRLTTPFNNVRRGSVTWDEIQRVISRGGELISP